MTQETAKRTRGASIGKLAAAASVVLLALGALYFRTFLLRPPDVFQFMMVYRAAREEVLLNLKRKVERDMGEMAIRLSPEEKKRVVEARAKEIVRVDPYGFRKTVMNVAQTVLDQRPTQRQSRYLLEADPYYYLYLTKQIDETGRIGKLGPNREYFNPLRLAPQGAWERLTLHPYLGHFWYRLVRRLSPQTGMMAALATVPLALTVAVLLAFFGLLAVFRIRFAAAWLGATALILAPITIQRSAYGWYDTDPYNYLFPVAMLTLFVLGLGGMRKAVIAAVLAGAATWLYSYFWNGWPLIFVLILAGAGAGATVAWLREGKAVNVPAVFAAVYGATTLTLTFLLLSPGGASASFGGGSVFLSKFSLAYAELWPNPLALVGEIKPTGLAKLVVLSGNWAVFILMLVGLVAEGFRSWNSRERSSFSRWLMVMVMAVSLFFLAMRVERFSLFCVLPLGIGVAWGAETVLRLIERGLSRLTARWSAAAARPLALALLLGGWLPFIAYSAGEGGGRVRLIMNDTWYNGLKEIREKTPEDATVYSWWPPGHFITSLAERRVVIDGGSQHRPQSYWVARAFLAVDEREAAGIFRMLGASGNDAVAYLVAKGFELPEAIDRTGSVVAVSRDKARSLLPESWSDTEDEEFLNLTHGKKPPQPAYVLLYNDLIRQNLAMSLVARWDFRKAKKVMDRRGYIPGDDLDYLLSMTEGILNYTPEASLSRKGEEGMVFTNGLVFNPETMEARIDFPNPSLGRKPASLFWMSDGKLVEKSFPGETARESALLMERSGEYTSVIAAPELARSMLFRMYYLDGIGLLAFRPFLEHRDPDTGTVLRVYEIDWDALEGSPTP
jgi:dolichyl-diphosphooligosaccharide--protein glycosyltransferase